MDSRWYLFPGQTVDNTKISDRAHALHITKSGWNGITKHLDRKKLLQEAADRDAAVKRYLDEGSKNMTKGWENSLENVRKRKEEERLQLIEQKKEERQQRFLELRKEQEEIRAKYMEKVKQQIYMTSGQARELTSALVLSEVLFERQKQQEFMKKIKDHEREEDREYLEFQRKKAEKEANEEKEKKVETLEKQKAYTRELKKTIEEKASLETNLREKRIKREALDNIEAIKETEKLDRLVLEDKLRQKKELFEQKKRFLKQKEEQELQKLKEEKELDEVVQIYQEAKYKIDCMKKLREKEMRNEAIQSREKMSALVMAEQEDQSAIEEQRLKKAMAERDAAEMEKMKRKREHQKKLIRDRLQNREEVLAREADNKRKEEELKKWELLNRYKANENLKVYEENRKRELWRDILAYRKDLCEQMEDVKEEQLREKEIELALETTSLKDDDSKFFEYAEDVLQLAKKRGRTTIPIERVIAKYVKEMNIHSEKYEHLDPCKPKISKELKKTLTQPGKPKFCKCRCPKM